ncbi:MAG TPA: aspartate kinase [Bacteroidales bacterium]|nr:aspartate kinase [Bacteroidales bacterium]
MKIIKQIYKFGGASIKNAEALINVVKIIENEKDLIIVISAIDKTTNELEKLVNAYFKDCDSKNVLLNNICDFHTNYLKGAFIDNYDEALSKLNILLSELRNKINSQPTNDYDLEYDAIVSYGELFSSSIFSEFLKHKGISNSLIDARQALITDSNHRDAKINWQNSSEPVKNIFGTGTGIFITQGFIGRASNGEVTTLGREGSDYSASALAYLLNANSVTIWKDVPGIMNADPDWCSFAEKLDVLSYLEAIELAFFGAKIIHPKTIKPLENKDIPMYVKSFKNPDETGTIIKKLDYKLKLIPVYILKTNQILISISPKDFSFIVEENISKIFGLFAQYKAKVNITQNSAVSFSASIDGDNRYFKALIGELQKEFYVKYNTNLELVTIRYYTDDAVHKMTNGKKILIEQKSRSTARFLLQC